jgi:hypothetical protein
MVDRLKDFDADRKSKNGISYAGCLPYMRQNFLLSKNNV